MNIQTLTTYARKHVFESARFYYGVLVALTFHLVFRHSLIKFLTVNGESEWLASKVVTAILYGSIYGCCIVSAVFLRKKISKLFLYTWLIISCISVFNEFRFYLDDPRNHNFISSISSGQGFMNVRITLPILFLAVWQALKFSISFSKHFIRLIYIATIVNSFFVCVGVVFDVSIFESYPMSGRWGYSGIFARGYSVILSSLFLIDLLSKYHFFSVRSLLFVAALLCSGTKAGLLSLVIIVFWGTVRSKKTQFAFAGVGLAALTTLPKWMAWIVSFSPFWQKVYLDHGPWGVLFSLRNENLATISNYIQKEYLFTDWIVGGNVRFESFYVEVVPIDIFVWYGLVGFFALIRFFYLITPNLNRAIPVIVGCFSGALINAPLAFIIWMVWMKEKKVVMKNGGT